MTNGSDRLDRIEGILEQVARSQERGLQEVTVRPQDVSVGLREVTRTVQGVTGSLREVDALLKDVATRQREMAARQQYRDEAFVRHDAEMKSIREAVAADADNMRALVRISEIHHRRPERLEGGEPV